MSRKKYNAEDEANLRAQLRKQHAHAKFDDDLRDGLRTGEVHGQSFAALIEHGHTFETIISKYVLCGNSKNKEELDKLFGVTNFFDRYIGKIYRNCICGHPVEKNHYISLFEPDSVTGVDAKNPILAIGCECKKQFVPLWDINDMYVNPSPCYESDDSDEEYVPPDQSSDSSQESDDDSLASETSEEESDQDEESQSTISDTDDEATVAQKPLEERRTKKINRLNQKYNQQAATPPANTPTPSDEDCFGQYPNDPEDEDGELEPEEYQPTLPTRVTKPPRARPHSKYCIVDDSQDEEEPHSELPTRVTSKSFIVDDSQYEEEPHPELTNRVPTAPLPPNVSYTVHPFANNLGPVLQQEAYDFQEMTSLLSSVERPKEYPTSVLQRKRHLYEKLDKYQYKIAKVHAELRRLDHISLT
jgi:hypothetical protein